MFLNQRSQSWLKSCAATPRRYREKTYRDAAALLWILKSCRDGIQKNVSNITAVIVFNYLGLTKSSDPGV